MNVPISEFRSHLREWLDRARAGETVVITERGLPVARVVSVDVLDVMDRLAREGVITRPFKTKRRRASEATRVKATGPVAELVSELRRR